MSAPQPYYDDGQVQLYLGDCLDVLAGIPDASIDSIVTDPPYGLEFMGREWDTFRPPNARIRERVDGRTNPAEGKSVTRTPEAYVAGRPFQAWCEAWARECLRVLKPGGHMLAFGGTRTWHRLACAVEDAGFEIRDSVADLTGIDGPGLLWVYGSGFPKSLDVSKAIDKQRDDRPDILRVTSWLADVADAAGVSRAQVDAYMGTSDMGGWWLSRLVHRCAVPTWEQWARLRDLLGYGDEMDAEVWRLNGRKGLPGEAWQAAEVIGTEDRFNEPSGIVNAGQGGRAAVTRQMKAPNSEDAARWSGWGTALKPAWEPIVVGRKPLAGTVAANILEHGTGALNIGGCRVNPGVPVGDGGGLRGGAATRHEGWRREAHLTGESSAPHDAGRWPPNVLLGDEAAAELDRQSGVLTSGANPARRGSDKFRDAYGDFAGQAECTVHRGADSGGASRFFRVFRYEAKAAASERPRLPDGTAHPTVKPLDLMRWLVRLVTPPGGTVGDFFAGSGTTGEACVIEGFNCVLIEKDPASAELIKMRLSKPIQPVMFGDGAA